MDYGLIVCDASPLITLSKAGQLNVLLKQPWPITVPDAVYREAANEAHTGGVTIAGWIEANQNRVRVAATEAGVEQDVLIRAGLKARNAGENAAMEVINRFLESAPDKRAVLLYEDDDVRKLPILDRADIVTTGAFLSALEMARAIQSADFILKEAAKPGATSPPSRLRRGKPHPRGWWTGSWPGTTSNRRFRRLERGTRGADADRLGVSLQPLTGRSSKPTPIATLEGKSSASSVFRLAFPSCAIG